MKFTKGQLTVKHGALIVVLVVALYAVFPRTEATTTADALPAADATSANVDVSSVVNAATAQSASAVPVVSPAASQSSPIASKQSTADESLTVRPVPAVTKSLLAKLVDDNLFAVASAMVETVVDDDTGLESAAVAEPVVPEVPLVVTRTAGAKVSLVYSSSRGGAFAVLNGSVVKPGDITESGLKVESISSDGLDVRAAVESAQP